MVCLKLDPHASAGVTAAFGLACAPLKVVTDAGGANCLILWESDTGSTMEKQSRNAGVESEQTLKTFKHVANICSLSTLDHFGTYYHCRLL